MVAHTLPKAFVAAGNDENKDAVDWEVLHGGQLTLQMKVVSASFRLKQNLRWLSQLDDGLR